MIVDGKKGSRFELVDGVVYHLARPLIFDPASLSSRLGVLRGSFWEQSCANSG